MRGRRCIVNTVGGMVVGLAALVPAHRAHQVQAPDYRQAVHSLLGGMMPDTQADAATEQVNSLMLAELSHWGDALLHSEESGEGRVTILLAAIGAAATALPVIVKPESSPWTLLWLLPVLGLLLLLGLFTLIRLANRNLHTDFCLLQLWTIRKYFADQYPEQLSERRYPEGMVDAPRGDKRSRKWNPSQILVGHKGGHVELVEWANAALFAMMAFIALTAILSLIETSPYNLPRYLVPAGAIAGFAFRLGEFQLVNWYYQRNDPKPKYRGLLPKVPSGHQWVDGHTVVATGPATSARE